MIGINHLIDDAVQTIYHLLSHQDRRNLAQTSKRLLKIFHKMIVQINLPSDAPHDKIIIFLSNLSSQKYKLPHFRSLNWGTRLRINNLRQQHLNTPTNTYNLQEYFASLMPIIPDDASILANADCIKTYYYVHNPYMGKHYGFDGRRYIPHSHWLFSGNSLTDSTQLQNELFWGTPL